MQKVDFSSVFPIIRVTESKIFIYPAFYLLHWSICGECLPPADFGEWEEFSCSTVWLLKRRWSEENCCLFVFVVRSPLKYLWPFLCRLQPFVLWITHLRARHWFWMPKSAFLLVSCLENGITCSLVRRLINPCGKLVFHNAECLNSLGGNEQSPPSETVLHGLQWMQGLQGKYSCKAAWSGTALVASLCVTSLQPWHENACQVGWMEIVWERCFQRSGPLFPSIFWLLCEQETISGFCVRFWFLFLCCVEEKAQGCLLTWIYGSAQRREKNALNYCLHMFKSTQIPVAEPNGIIEWSQCQQISMDSTSGDGKGIDVDAPT